MGRGNVPSRVGWGVLLLRGWVNSVGFRLYLILWSCRIFESVKAGREEVHGRSLSGAVAGSGRRFVAGDRSPVRGVFALRARRGDVRACGRSGVYCSLDG